MNKIQVAVACLLVVIALGCAFSASAQVATGTPPFGSFGGGPDVINLANLNGHLTVPVLSKAGRGMPFTYNLIYDSSVWTPVTSGSTTTWQPVANWGWGATTQVATGILTATVTDVQECYCTHNGNLYLCGHAYTWSNWAYLDKFGVSHPFTGVTYTETTTACGAQNPQISSTATDGSGYSLVAQGSSGTVTARGGTIVLPQTNVGNGSATRTDSNGNQISVNSAGVFTDTLGTTALTVSGSAPNPTVFAYTGPSGAAQYTMKYAPYTIQTNFGCSGIGEYSAANVSLVSEIDLPDGTKYTFTYEPTYQHSPNVTGRLASVTLPTGGTISNAYGSGGVNGITCADGSASSLTRTTPDGTWTYTHTESGTAWITLVTDPTAQQNQTNINFQGIYETERQVYSGSKSSGTLLKTLITCYNGTTTNCNTTAVTQPITQRTVTLQWPGTGGKQSQLTTKYNNIGFLTETDEYDYGNGAPGALLRQTLTTYWTPNGILWGRPLTVTVKDGGGNVKAQTTYQYDQYSVASTSGTPQHVAPPDPSGHRGNLTNVSSLVQGSATLNSLVQYFDTGNPQTAYDVNGAQTSFTYGTGSCGNSFVTSVSEPLSLSRSMTWNCNGGVQSSTTDENGKTATIAYNDPYFWRINSLTDANSNVTSMTYNGATSVESAMVFNGNNSTVDLLTTVDALGRGHVTQKKQSPSSSSYDSSETDFDTRGTPNRTTIPYSGTAGQTNSSGPSGTASYDPLGRKSQAADAGGGTVTWTYTQNDTYQTVGPAPTGENTKRKQFEYDGLGRLTSVCEVTSMTGSGTCTQTSSQTGFWTKYTYDTLGNLTGVTQNAQSGSSQTRSYGYDDLGRLISETNPESGTQNYVYDSDSTCGTSSGDLVKRTDAVGNTICYAYDALHRNTSVTYSGPYAANTPNKYFVFDSATVNSVAMASAKTRLAEAYTATCSTCAKITDLGFSYTALGQVSDVYESTPHSSGYYHVTASYWAHGALNQLSNLMGLPTITYNVDGEGRVYSVTASSGQNPVTLTNYNVSSRPTQLNFGSSDSDAFTYDPNTNRMTQYKFNVNGQSVIGNLGWNANGSLASLSITDPFNSNNAQSCSYSSDDVSRIASANCGAGWAQTFTYDAFGNISKSGTQSFQPTYSYVTNRMTQVGSTTPTYDANGNSTFDTLHNYTWNAAGMAVTIDSVTLTYDALNRMIEQNKSGNYSEIVYAPTGAKLAIMNGTSLTKAFVPLPTGAVAVYNSSGIAYYRHSDWVGSSRFASTPSRTMYFDAAYAPFGEPYAQAGTSDLSFTGMNQDTVSGLYDFAAREYSIQGRWPSPDPSGLSATGLRNPQSFNRYAYVSNRPLIAVDPLGLRECLNINDSGGCGRSGGGGGGGLGLTYTGFTIDGVPVSAELAQSILKSGSGAVVNGWLAGAPRWEQVDFLSSVLASLSGSIGSGDPSSLLIYDFCNGGAGPTDPSACTGNTSSATTCDASGCSNSTIVSVNATDASSGPLDANPCFSGEALCQAQLAQFQCDDPPCISSSAQQIGGMVNDNMQAWGNKLIMGMAGLEGVGVGGVLGGASLAVDTAYQGVGFFLTHPVEVTEAIAGFGAGIRLLPPMSPSGWLGWLVGNTVGKKIK
jgi:RHS repeat-associated protein